MENNTEKMRCSFTVMSMWADGKWEDAIKYYFKLERIETEAMRQGLAYHKEWEAETLRTGALPAIFGGAKLIKPATELKLSYPMADWLDLTGKMDCLDSPTLYEYKTGKTESDSYARSFQMPVYALLAIYNGVIVTKGEVHHYDQYNKKADMSIVWITDKMLRDALSWVETVGSEMFSYFTENKLFDRYGNYRLQPDGKVKFIKAGGSSDEGGAPVPNEGGSL
jgi:hypothetical protein